MLIQGSFLSSLLNLLPQKGVVKMALTIYAVVATVVAVLAIKIVAAHLYKTIDSYLDKHDAQIMDLIKWAKENEN